MLKPLVGILSFILGLTALVSAQQLTFEKKAEGWLLKESEHPRYFYQTQTKDKNGQYPRANYIHPLYGLDGEVLTEDFPKDHLHHRGIFWTWHQLWVDGERIADPWVCEGIEWIIDEVTTQVQNDKKASLEASVLWRETGKKKRYIIQETVLLHFERLTPDLFQLDFEITMQPLVEKVSIGGSEDPKGYGGFSPRVKLSEKVGFFDTNGKVEPRELPVDAGPWINITDEGKEEPGVVIMGIPEELPSYQGWILRSKNSMQNMAFPGRSPLPFNGKPIKFRNRVLIHRGLTTAEIEVNYKDFLAK
ncbi:MAG: DUF6807 family protein [Cyclobacteriaceae bacterium]